MSNMKTILKPGLLVLSTLILATPALSQEGPASVDPVTQENIDVLTESGIIERQAKIGQDILIIEREIRRVKQVQELMELIGYEGVIALYPEMADVVKGSPLEVRARLRQAELERDLDEVLNPEADSTPSRSVSGDGSGEGSEEAPTGLMDAPIAPRPGDASDGARTSGEQDFTAALEEARQQIMSEMQAELDRRNDPGDEQSAQPISLRAIYGTRGNLRAVIFHGSERVQVREGDTLPGNVTIHTIGQDFILLDRAGREIRLSLRG